MTETDFAPIPEDRDDKPVTDEGVVELVRHSLAAVGHAQTLRFLSDQIETAFEVSNTPEVQRIIDLLEFTTVELLHAAEKAEGLVMRWGNYNRQQAKETADAG